MADQPKSWLIVLALQAQLRGITVANGYLTDAGHNVWIEPAQRDESAALGISIVTEHIDRVEGERPHKREREITIPVEAAISTSQDNAHELAHQLIEDVERSIAALTAAAPTPPVPGVMPFEIGNIEFANQPEGLAVIGVQIPIIARYFR